MELIDRDALLNEDADVIEDNGDYAVFGYSAERIKSAPVVDAIPVVHGRWIGKPIAGYATVKCSTCHQTFRENTGLWGYCPNCGAKMSKEENYA